MANRARKVFVVDDHPLIRAGLAAVLRADPDLELSGEAEGATDAFSKLANVQPDIVITDLNLGSILHGLDFIRALRSRFPQMRILVCSMHDEKLYGEKVLRAGANGFVSKALGSEELLRAARVVMDGQMYIGREIERRMVADYINGKPGEAKSVTELLTDRELEIYRMIGWGLSGREIAQALEISKSTVESHRVHIKEKLGLTSPSALVRSAVAWVLQNEPDQGGPAVAARSAESAE
ncbi:MAG: response regulator transcription factor [Leptospirales bacterium]|nr:response regulator transcription factor [Leptospirales bacterium]